MGCQLMINIPLSLLRHMHTCAHPVTVSYSVHASHLHVHAHPQTPLRALQRQNQVTNLGALSYQCSGLRLNILPPCIPHLKQQQLSTKINIKLCNPLYSTQQGKYYCRVVVVVCLLGFYLFVYFKRFASEPIYFQSNGFQKTNVSAPDFQFDSVD